ncbi:carboxypeptidase regulatory-like domain-containing protein [bacterium AH-315-C07]|nr:carboxypeptidase regulatory-like domain-containing protein [bacterium AH-315-C07]
MQNRILFTFLISIFSGNILFAQTGTIKGTITDTETGETLPFAAVVVKQDGKQKGGSTTDFDGDYTIKPLNPGNYDLEVQYVGYNAKILAGVLVKSDRITFLDVKLGSGIDLDEVEIIEYEVPLIDKDNTSTGGTLTAEEIRSAPTRDIGSIVATSAGVYQADEGSGLNIRGSRGESTSYYVDGVKVRGNIGLPQSGIEQITVITGGTPAQYGDATGGVINVTTKGSQRTFNAGVEFETSQFLDPYGHNLLNVNLSGPLMFRKTDTSKIDPIAGFFVAAEVSHNKDKWPSIVGTWKVKDDKLKELQDNPLAYDASTGNIVRSAEFIKADDLEPLKAKQNTDRFNGRISGKMDFEPSLNTRFVLGGNFDYIKRNQFISVYYLFNPENYPEIIETTYRMYAKFTQKFKNAEMSGDGTDSDEARSRSIIQNAYYSVQVDYSGFDQTIQDKSHGDNFFNYGYVGKFKTYRSPVFEDELKTDTFGLTGYMLQSYRIDSITFERSEVNARGANYTSQYYELSDKLPTSFDEDIQKNNGMINGDRPPNIYNIWFNTGRQYNDFFKGHIDQYRLNASASADIGDHAIKFGVEYEQNVERFWRIGPIGIWSPMRQLTNFHLQGFDKANPYYLTAGDAFADRDTIMFNRKYVASDQSTFDKNLRKKLGLAVDGTDWIDIDALDPETFSIDMFSAKELTENGIVNYYGYNYDGTKQTSKPSLNDFLTDDDNLPVAPFSPIYTAGYIQDKFAYKDLVFNIGLRVDRYDANQSVLRDRYSLYDVLTVGEVRANNKDGIDLESIPSTIGDDFVVYVDNNERNSQKTITGYRDVDNWYNSEGTLITNPDIIANKSGGKALPYLSEEVEYDPESGLPVISASSFTDFRPQVSYNPRIAFSFPISDEALFFAHYDVLSERPRRGGGGYTSTFVSPNRFNPFSYRFFEGGFVQNPNLKPVRTIDYEVGFKQKLSSSSALTLSAFYKELKDLIQYVGLFGAYPQTYYTLDNLDFGTIKGFSVDFDLRRTGNIRLKASYTLQFADGTGSGATTAGTLVQAGLPNLRTPLPLRFDQRHNIVASVDYRYGEGSEYNGPRWFGKAIFENTGANFIFKLGSGTPYSRQANFTPEALMSGLRVTREGTPMSNRKPWTTNVSVKFDRAFKLWWGGKDEGEERKSSDFIVYLQIQNMFNIWNVMRVYEATGTPDDDGYLTSVNGVRDVNSQLDPESFELLYRIRMAESNLGGSHYQLPRRIRLGVILNF